LYVLNIIYRYKKRVELLTNNLTNLQNEMHNMSDSSIDNIFKNSNVNESQQILIREILNTSKVQAKNKRYTENWILLCILFHIR